MVLLIDFIFIIFVYLFISFYEFPALLKIMMIYLLALTEQIAVKRKERKAIKVCACVCTYIHIHCALALLEKCSFCIVSTWPAVSPTELESSRSHRGCRVIERI